MAAPLMLSPIPVTWVDKRRSSRAGITDATALTIQANFVSPLTLDAALTAAIPTVYTVALLQKMQINDKVYALRMIQENGSI